MFTTIKDFKFIDSEIYENKKMQHNLAKFVPVLGTLNNTLKPTINLEEYKYIMHFLSPLLYIPAKFVPSDKRIKTIDIICY